MVRYKVKFLPDGRETTVEEGKTLLDAARQANVYVEAVCGGEGICGKCRVIVRQGEVLGESTEFLTRDEIRRGYVLACRVVPRSNVVVEVPPESRLDSQAAGVKDSDLFRDFAHRGGQHRPAELEPLVDKISLALAEPTLDDSTADEDRLLEAVVKRRPGPLQMGLKISRELPRVLRRCRQSRASWSWTWDGRVTATVGVRGETSEVLCVERGDTSDRLFGVALDVGTTTVVAHLVDLTSGTTRAAAAKYNSQIEYGADVINRINHARQPGGATTLHEMIIHDVNALIDELIERARVGRGDIYCVVAAGNTTMLHFLLGLEVDLIRLAPFVPATTSPPPIRAAEIGLRIHPRAVLYTMPMLGSYVGGDITAGILATGMYQSKKLCLLLDIGTNGEVVLGNREFLVACSASAGPAFEGATVSCGMRATNGAIDSVRIFRRGLNVSVTTIDDSPPVGFCGSGLIDALAEMFTAGVVDRTGRFQTSQTPKRFRISQQDDRPEFVLVSAAESGGHRDIVISQADVDNLIRAKGAIYAAADSLTQSLGLTFDQIERLYIAGGFGNELDVSHCITVGLLPDIPTDRIRFVGNSAAAGTRLAMLSRKLFDEIHEVRDRIAYEELTVAPEYMEKFTSACFLPHTDLSRFPSIADRLTSGTATAPETPPSENTTEKGASL